LAVPQAPNADRPGRGPAAAGRTRPVTMRDVARATNLSQSTVSRVLNRKTTIVPIAEETRERVFSTAIALGYRPNPLARGLRGSKTMLLGVIVREITDPFFGGAIDAVTTAASARGYNVVLGHAHARAEEAITLWGVLEARHCDAILLLGDMTDQPRLLDDLASAHVPVVALWQGRRAGAVPSVAVNNDAGIAAALDHLIENGHRRIAFVGGRQLGDIKEREEAFVRHLAARRVKTPKAYLQHGTNDPATGIAAVEHLLALREPPTAIVAATDMLATGVLHGAYAHGVSVPDQLSVTGFDDLPSAAYTVPALTTVRMPVREMVEHAARLALDSGADTTEVTPVLEPSLVVRASTARAPLSGRSVSASGRGR
jgi:DNA-binding LacI/PurR family transcriptional regulator